MYGGEREINKIVAGLTVIMLVLSVTSIGLVHSAFAHTSEKTADGKIKNHFADKSQNYVKSKAIAKAAGEKRLAELQKQHKR